MEPYAGLLQLKDLRQRKKEEQERKEREALLRENGVYANQSANDNFKVKVENARTKVKKMDKKRAKPLSVNEEDDEGENSEELSSRRKLKTIRNNDGNNSYIKTPKDRLKERRLKEEERRQFVEKQSEIKEEVVTIPFVYYDDEKVPSNVTVKKGDPIWVLLEKTRKGRKKFHRGTVDDILFVKDSIIIPHNYDLCYFQVNPVNTKKGLLFDFDNLQRDSVKVVHAQWYQKNKHIFPMSHWKTFSPDIDYAKLVERDANGVALYKQDV